MLSTIQKIIALFDDRERRSAVLLFVMMLVMGVWEVIGVASVLPFIAVVSAPETVQKSFYLRTMYETLGFTDTDTFLLFLGGIVFVLVVGSLSFKAVTEWAIARFVHMHNYSLSCRLLRNYMVRPYSYFLSRHSADLGKSVLNEVQQVTSAGLMPAMHLVANVVVVVLLFGLVLNVEPLIALTAFSVLGGFYVAVYMVARKYLKRIGSERLIANKERFKVAQDAFGGIKEIKVLGLEDGFINAFRGPALRYSRSQAYNQIITQVPQFALQGVAFGGVLVILLILLASKSGDIKQVLPILALYAFAGLRLLPALQQVYAAVARLRYVAPVIESIHSDLSKFVRTDAAPLEKAPKMRLHQSLHLERVDFSYPRVDGPTLEDISLKIGANRTVAFVGPTGSGKTTIVDLILGLLVPQKGRLMVDGKELGSENRSSWQQNIGYVPQQIFLSDDTIAANIAFGLPPDTVEASAVEHAARIANLHNFVVHETTDGYNTLVGERGVRLSGGQRQRIGIARAMYHDPDVLVLDEATSALDNKTEKAVIKAIHQMSGNKTIILIAHRLSTVRACDTIFLLDGGKIAASGSYDELLSTSEKFQSLVNA